MIKLHIPFLRGWYSDQCFLNIFAGDLDSGIMSLASLPTPNCVEGRDVIHRDLDGT